MGIFAAIQWVQTQMIAVTGVKTAPDYPGAGEFPIVITHLGPGVITPGEPAGQVLSLDTIVIELHVSAGGGLAPAFATIETLHPLIVAKITADYTLGGYVQTYEQITHNTTITTWQTVETVARVYNITGCKIIT